MSTDAAPARSRWLRRAAIAGGIALFVAAAPAAHAQAADGLTRAVGEIGGAGKAERRIALGRGQNVRA